MAQLYIAFKSSQGNGKAKIKFEIEDDVLKRLFGYFYCS